MSNSNLLSLSIKLSEVEACALASMLPSLGWHEIRPLVKDEVQAFHTRSALASRAVALTAHGYAPRAVGKAFS